MNKLIKTQQELEDYQKEVRDRQYEPNPVTVEFGGDSWNDSEPYDFNKEYIKVIRTNNHEVVERIKYEQIRQNIHGPTPRHFG